MREVKFRGKRPNSGKWIMGYLFQKDGFSWILSDKFPAPECSCEVLTETVGQFTGLKDKNGKDIYEGDVCTFSDWIPKEIRWFDGRFRLGDSLVICCKMECDNMEVIGNIYEN